MRSNSGGGAGAAASRPSLTLHAPLSTHSMGGMGHGPMTHSMSQLTQPAVPAVQHVMSAMPAARLVDNFWDRRQAARSLAQPVAAVPGGLGTPGWAPVGLQPVSRYMADFEVGLTKHLLWLPNLLCLFLLKFFCSWMMV